LDKSHPWAAWGGGGAHADIYKVHVKTRKIVQLTHQERSPNTGVMRGNYSYPVYNTGPCPLPGGKVMFTSSRNGYKPPRRYPVVTLQLFVMDDDGRNVEQIGYINIAGALHPTILVDGRVIFSTLESQGLKGGIVWGIWAIHPDGSYWEPIISAMAGG